MALPRNPRQAELEEKKKKPEPKKFREVFKDFFTSREDQLFPAVQMITAAAALISLDWFTLIMFVK